MTLEKSIFSVNKIRDKNKTKISSFGGEMLVKLHDNK